MRCPTRRHISSNCSRRHLNPKLHEQLRGDPLLAPGPIGRRKAETLLATKFAERRPALSPDGRWLAYESDESGQPEIYVRPFPDTNSGRWQVSTSGGNEPRWAPNGHALFYRASTLMSVTTESKNTFVAHAPESLFPLTRYRQISRVPNYDVSRDGERFLFVKPIVSPTNEAGLTFSRIIVVQNWFEELKRLVPAK
jgi:eukaryotic-like serine/threonine-protein kinase